ncbi:MAG: TetR/AcrR family transcriptional regulator [Flavobacteriaceae bacterium]|nr:TetR/AcrR family transcriptional regulator [Flavobacteriaceae bacterium]
MTPKTPEQFEMIRKERKDLLMAAALKLFASKGFATTSIMDIAREAGVSKGLLYNYFESKDELVKEIVLEGIQKITIDIDFDFSIKLDKQRFIQLIDKYFELIEQSKDYWKLYMAVLAQPTVGDLVKGELFMMLEPFFSAVSQYYADKNEKNPLAFAFLLGAILDGVGIDYIFAPEQYPLMEIKEIIIEKLI